MSASNRRIVPVYVSRYGYPWRWALLAELFWRIEHGPALRGWGYRMRKACEHRGSRV